MMQSVLVEMMARRRDRCIAVILGLKERECDQYLAKDASEKLRKVILDQVNDLYAFNLDICNSLDQPDEGVVLNEYHLNRLDEIHQMISELVVDDGE